VSATDALVSRSVSTLVHVGNEILGPSTGFAMTLEADLTAHGVVLLEIVIGLVSESGTVAASEDLGSGPKIDSWGPGIAVKC
jgi:hypothetical protein